ncbi:MAG: M23 family metallopeptidase [Candidatus Limnocylindrales bacterium]
MRRPHLRRSPPGRIGVVAGPSRPRPWFVPCAGLLAATFLLLPLDGALPIARAPSALTDGDGALPAVSHLAVAPELGPADDASDPGGSAPRLATGDTTPADAGRTLSAAPETLRGYVWPVQNARVTTWYAPIDGGFVVVAGERIHDGLDLATFCGDTIRAAHGGRVLYVGRQFDPYLGYDEPPDAFFALLKAHQLPWTVLPLVVVVDDGDGYRSVYVHLASASVHSGVLVRAGQTIGREGMTGHATGCHLHYGLIRMDGPYVAVAPELVAKWQYPAWVRTRVDPLLVLDPFSAGAARELPGLPPPAVSPGGPSHAAMVALWRARQAPAPVDPGDASGLRGE